MADRYTLYTQVKGLHAQITAIDDLPTTDDRQRAGMEAHRQLLAYTANFTQLDTAQELGDLSDTIKQTLNASALTLKNDVFHFDTDSQS